MLNLLIINFKIWSNRKKKGMLDSENLNKSLVSVPKET